MMPRHRFCELQGRCEPFADSATLIYGPPEECSSPKAGTCLGRPAVAFSPVLGGGLGASPALLLFGVWARRT